MFAIVLGTRPEIIKLSPIIRELKKRKLPFILIHSNQHYSYEMDKAIFDDLDLEEPDFNLHISGRTGQSQMVAEMMIELEKIFLQKKPKCVIVQGDTNTVLAASLVASKMSLPLAHVEAGLRSYDRSMPEEVNRVVTDHVSSFLFCPTEKQRDIVFSEGIRDGVAVVGNTVVDAVMQNLKKVDSRKITQEYGEYILLTLHRPSNVDDPQHLGRLIDLMSAKAREKNVKILFPLHPRTAQVLDKAKITLDEAFVVLEPQPYLRMLGLQSAARLIATDSGGIQEEACILGVPCLTLRSTTERPETVDVGANILASNIEMFDLYFEEAWQLKPNWQQPFGDGRSSEYIVDTLVLAMKESSL